MKQIQGHGLSENATLAILDQIGKDKRTLSMNGSATQLFESTHQDEQPTQKQLNLLNQLGIQIPEGLSKKGASELISQNVTHK